MDVVCRQLGNAGLLQNLHGAPRGAGEFTLLPIIWNCSGNDSNILECGSLINSSHCEAATIACESIDSKSMHNLFCFTFFVQSSIITLLQP